MAEHISSWISKAVVKYDREHGSHLKAGVSRMKCLAQIQKFYTFRRPEAPQAQIVALISDKTHHIVAEFDVEATNRFESEDTDLPPERLTSKLRHIIAIKSYRWKLEPPSKKTTRHGLEMPVLKMEILDFDDYAGSSDSPNYFEGAVDVGWGMDDGAVQQVLRKWYFGESHSDMSEVEKSFERSQPSQGQAGPSRLSMSSPQRPSPPSTLPEGIVSLADFLEPYLAESGSKQGKAIPDWLFETSEEDVAALKEIRVFGLDLTQPAVDSPSAELRVQVEPQLSSSPVVPAPDPPVPSAPSPKLDKGKGRAEAPASQWDLHEGAESQPALPVPLSSMTHSPPVPLGQRMRSTQTATHAITAGSSSAPADDEQSESDSDSDVEMEIKAPRIAPARRSRLIFDPLAFPRPTPDDIFSTNTSGSKVNKAIPVEEEEDDSEAGAETESDMLSDYERENRSKHKRPRTASPSRDTALPQVIQVEEDESIPASESIESYSLTKQYPSPSKREHRETEMESSMVVDHGVVTTTSTTIDVTTESASLEKSQDSSKSNTTRGTGTGSLPTPPPSDHDHDHEPEQEQEQEAQLPSLELELESGPKATHRVVDPSPRKRSRTPTPPRAAGPSVPKVESGQWDRYQHPSSTTKPHIEQSVGDRHRLEQRVEQPSPRLVKQEPSSSRKPNPHPSVLPSNEASSSRRTLQERPATAVDRGRYTLDLSVQGLSRDTIQEYITKVRAARSAGSTQKQTTKQPQ